MSKWVLIYQILETVPDNSTVSIVLSLLPQCWVMSVCLRLDWGMVTLVHHFDPKLFQNFLGLRNTGQLQVLTRLWRAWHSRTRLVGRAKWCSHLETIWQVLQKLTITIWQTVPLLSIYPRETKKTCSHKAPTRMSMALDITSPDEWVHLEWCVHTMEYYSAIERMLRESKHKRPHTMLFHLHEMSRINKSETESRLVVASGMR